MPWLSRRVIFHSNPFSGFRHTASRKSLLLWVVLLRPELRPFIIIIPLSRPFVMHSIIHMFNTSVIPYTSLDQYLTPNLYTIQNVQNMRFFCCSVYVEYFAYSLFYAWTIQLWIKRVFSFHNLTLDFTAFDEFSERYLYYMSSKKLLLLLIYVIGTWIIHTCITVLNSFDNWSKSNISVTYHHVSKLRLWSHNFILWKGFWPCQAELFN